MSKLTKKQQKVQEMLADFTQPATAVDALKKLQEISKETSKFNETVECHMRLGIDVRQADQQIRSTVVLPAGLGKTVRVCVIAKGAKATEATEAGADFAGAEEIIDKIIAENADSVESYKNGNQKIFGFLMGQVVRTAGKGANPKLAKDLLTEKLK